MTDVNLLSTSRNYAVVNLPDRAFPGAVFRGNSLNNLINIIRRAGQQHGPAEKSNELSSILDKLLEVQRGYENVLEQKGIRLPYRKAF
ncbi:DUF6959 family protein [Methylorubrum extorquens]